MLNDEVADLLQNVLETTLLWGLFNSTVNYTD